MKFTKRAFVPLLFGSLFVILWWQYQVIPKQIERWVKNLDSPSAPARSQAFASLKSLGERAAPLLLKGMETGSRNKKQQIASLLRHLGERALPWVKKGLQHKDWRIREVCLTVIPHLPSTQKTKVALLERAFNDKNPYARYTAVEQLSHLGSLASSLLPAMKRLLREGTHPLPGLDPKAQGKGHSHEHSREQKPHLLSAADQAGGDRHIARIIKGRLCGTPDDVDREARLSIVRYIHRIERNPKKAVQYILVAIKDRDRLVRNEAHKAILALGPAISPSLVTYLHHPKKPRRREVATTLGKMGVQVLPKLLPLLKNPALPTVWYHAAHAVQVMGAQARAKAKELCNLWPKLSARQQRKLANIVGKTGKSGIKCIIKNLYHPSVSMRAAASYAAGRWVFHNPNQTAQSKKLKTTLLRTLLKMLHVNEQKIWLESAWAMGEWGKKAKAYLTYLLPLGTRCPALQQKPTSTTLSACAFLLPQVWIKVGGNSGLVVSAIHQLLKSGTKSAKQGALRALLYAQPVPAILHTLLFQHLSSLDKKIRRAAIEVLAKNPKLLHSNIQKISRVLRTHTLPTQLDTLWLLSRIPRHPKLALALWPLLQQTLKTQTTAKLEKTLQVLLSLFPRNHKDSLFQGLAMLRHPKPSVRRAAVRLLSRDKPQNPGWVTLVMQLLKDPNWRVRREAVQTLGVWGPYAKKAEKAVQACLQDSSYAVSYASQFALLKIRKK